MKTIEKKYSTLRSKVLEHIEKEHISPHSRGYFYLRTFVTALSVMVLCFFVIYLLSFILYTLQKNGLALLSPFGAYGVFSILNDLPWKLVLIAMLALLGLLFLAKNTFTMYRLPLVYFFLVVIGFVGITGLYVAKSRMHPYVMSQFQHDTRERIRPAYLYLNPKVETISMGKLISSSTRGMFMISLDDGNYIEVRPNNFTKYVERESMIAGDRVLVFGERRGSVIFAEAVREIAR